MSGAVMIARSLFDHEVFAKEPLSEREAWIWLIMEASWKARKKRVGNVVADTQRGQLAASVRFLATAWGWTAPKVQRYLRRLEKMEMIRSDADTGVTVVTICKYEKYQAGGKSSDTAAIQQRYSSDTNENKDEIREKEDTPLTPQGDEGRFQEFWDAYPHRHGQKKNRKGAEAKFKAAIKRGVTADEILAGVAQMQRFPDVQRGYARDPATWLNQQGWTDEPPAQPSLSVVGGPKPYKTDAQGRPQIGSVMVNPKGETIRYVNHYEGWSREIV